MARKRGEYQRRQERKMTTGTVCALFLFLCVILLCIYGIVDSTYTIRQIDNGTFQEYTGKYSYEYVSRGRLFSRGRSRYYRLTLDNGVEVTYSAGSRYKEIFDENPVIHVKYFQEPFFNQYSAVSIATADGSVILKSLESSRQFSVSIIRAMPFVITFFSLLSVFFLMLLFKKQIIRFLRKRKKGKNCGGKLTYRNKY